MSKNQAQAAVSVKALAHTLGITGKKLRRFLRAHKYQRGDSRWELDAKTVKEVTAAFEKNPNADRPAKKAEKPAPAKKEGKAKKAPKKVKPDTTLAGLVTQMNPTQQASAPAA